MPRRCSRASRKSRSGSAVKVKRTIQKNPKPRKGKSKPVPLRERNFESLQALARSHGIPFGGLTRTALIDKLVAYGY